MTHDRIWGDSPNLSFWRPEVKRKKHPSLVNLIKDMGIDAEREYEPENPLTSDGFEPLDYNRRNPVYKPPNIDIGAAVADKVKKGIYEKALLTEKSQRRRAKEIRDYNRLGFFVQLWTGNSFTPMSMQGAASAKTSTPSNKNIVRAEKAMILTEFMKNPATSTKEAIAFAKSVNASPEGWAYITEKLLPKFDFGDVKELKKLNEDGTISIGRYLEGDFESLDDLLDMGFTLSGTEHQEKNRVIQDGLELKGMLDEFLTDENGERLPLNQVRLDAFINKNPLLIANKNMMSALNQWVQKLKLNPVFETFVYVGDGKKQPDKTIRTDGDSYTKLSTSSDWIAISKDKLYETTAKGLRSSLFKEIANDIQTYITPVEGDTKEVVGAQNTRLLKPLVEKRLLEKSEEWWLDEEKTDEYVSHILGLTTIKTQQAVGITALQNALLAGVQSGVYQETKDSGVEVMKQFDLRWDEPAVKSLWTSFNQHFKNAGEHVEVKAQWVYNGTHIIEKPAYMAYKGGPGELFPVNPEEDGLPEGEQEWEIINKGPVEGTFLVAGTKGDETGKSYMYHTSTAMQKEQNAISTNIIKWMKKPEEFKSTKQAYLQIYNTLEKQDTTSRSLDRAFGEIYKKIRDKSMVTNEEFNDLKGDIGWKGTLDMWVAYLKGGADTGHFTPIQRTHMLQIAHTWAESKAAAARSIVSEYKLSYDETYNPTTTKVQPGWDMVNMFRRGGLPLSDIEEPLPDWRKLVKMKPTFFTETKTAEDTTVPFSGYGSAKELLKAYEDEDKKKKVLGGSATDLLKGWRLRK